MRRISRGFLRGAVLCAIFGAGIGGCTTPSSDWWMFQSGPEHTGLYPGPRPEPPLELKWATALVGDTVALSPPVFGEGRIFIGSGFGDGRLFALSSQDGDLLWTFAAPVDNLFLGAPAAADGKVYAVTLGLDPHVYALEQESGALVWQRPLPIGSRGSIAISAGRVFVNTDEHRLYALAQGTGEVLWSAATSPGTSSQESSPAFHSGKVFVGSNDGLFAFDVVSGDLAWKFPLADVPGFSSPAIHTKVGAGNPALVFISTNDRKLYAVREDDGSLVWSYAGSATLAFSTVGLAAGKVFLFDFYGVIALDAATGTVVWNYQSPAIPRFSPAIAYGVLYYTDSAGVHGVEITNGGLVWSAALPGSTTSGGASNSFAIDRGLLVVPGRGQVFAFRGS